MCDALDRIAAKDGESTQRSAYLDETGRRYSVSSPFADVQTPRIDLDNVLHFKGCPSSSVWYLVASVAFYIGAIVTIAFSGDTN